MDKLYVTDEYTKYGDVELGSDQTEAINFIVNKKGAILSLQTGLGKTLSVLVASKLFMDNNEEYKTVIVCPVKALNSFRREIKRMKYHNKDIGVVSTKEMHYDTDKNKIIVFTDTNIKKYIDIVAELAAKGNKLILIIDEAHKLQDVNSVFYQTMSEVKSVCDIVWLVTATPLLNGLDSLYYIVDFVCPGFLGKKYLFDRTYIRQHFRDQRIKGGKTIKVRVIDGYKNLDKLNKELSKIMIVRQKKYNLKFSNIKKPMTQEEYDIYLKVSSGILKSDTDERNFSRRLHDLQRFLDNSYENDEVLKSVVSEYDPEKVSTKETTLIDTLKKCIDNGYSTIVYSDYTEVLDRLEKVLKHKKNYINYRKIYKIMGSIDIKTREKIEEYIKQNDIVLITSAGTESINLQKCNCLIFYDIPYSIKQIIQAVGRICRRDSKYKYQYCIFLTMEDTIDEYKFRLFQNHLNLVQQAVGAGSDIPLSEEYLIHSSRDIKDMKDEFLWKYKKKGKSNKKEMKMKIKTATIEEASNMIAANKFLIENIPCNNPEISPVKILFPDDKDYYNYVNNKVPFTVLRSKYKNYLESEKGKIVLENIIQGVHRTGDLILVGETELNKVLLDSILDYSDKVKF